jgi:DNA-binding CsgD family transcriptional regulator
MSTPGFVLIDGTTFKFLARNSEGRQILGYPADGTHTANLEPSFAHGVVSLVRNVNASKLIPVVTSGKRQYLCRAFPLEIINSDNENASTWIAVLLERFPSPTETIAKLSERFRLTPRESQVVQLLLGGLTSKEIAKRLNTSPNTVRTFLHLVMVKMGTSTRSGILGKLFESSARTNGESLVQITQYAAPKKKHLAHKR